MRKHYLSVFLFALILIDQVSKTWIFSIEHTSSIFTHFKNYHFAFSLQMPSYIIYGIYIAVGSSVIFYLKKDWKNFQNPQKIAWMLILAGGISNIGERLVLGYVRDFLIVPFGGIINLSDIYITIGIGYTLLNNNQSRTPKITH